MSIGVGTAVVDSQLTALATSAIDKRRFSTYDQLLASAKTIQDSICAGRPVMF